MILKFKTIKDTNYKIIQEGDILIIKKMNYNSRQEISENPIVLKSPLNPADNLNNYAERLVEDLK